MTSWTAGADAVGFASITGERAAASLQLLAAEELEMDMRRLAKLWRSLRRDPALGCNAGAAHAALCHDQLGVGIGKERERFAV